MKQVTTFCNRILAVAIIFEESRWWASDALEGSRAKSAAAQDRCSCFVLQGNRDEELA